MGLLAEPRAEILAGIDSVGGQELTSQMTAPM